MKSTGVEELLADEAGIDSKEQKGKTKRASKSKAGKKEGRSTTGKKKKAEFEDRLVISRFKDETALSKLHEEVEKVSNQPLHL